VVHPSRFIFLSEERGKKEGLAWFVVMPLAEEAFASSDDGGGSSDASSSPYESLSFDEFSDDEPLPELPSEDGGVEGSGAADAGDPPAAAPATHGRTNTGQAVNVRPGAPVSLSGPPKRPPPQLPQEDEKKPDTRAALTDSQLLLANGGDIAGEYHAFTAFVEDGKGEASIRSVAGASVRPEWAVPVERIHEGTLYRLLEDDDDDLDDGPAPHPAVRRWQERWVVVGKDRFVYELTEMGGTLVSVSDARRASVDVLFKFLDPSRVILRFGTLERWLADGADAVSETGLEFAAESRESAEAWRQKLLPPGAQKRFVIVWGVFSPAFILELLTHFLGGKFKGPL
jgi:hypothetical protein